jgi:hypothetical protein
VEQSGGTGHCEGRWNGDNEADCSLYVHYGAALCDAFTCHIEARARQTAPRCN